MLKTSLKALVIASIVTATSLGYAASIESSPQCAMKNLDVACENGDNIKLNVVRSHDKRGDIYLDINTQEAIGNYVTISINNSKPEVLKVEKLNHQAKGAFIPRAMIMKLRSATSLHFKISMQKRSPISGSLAQSHFDWLKQFGKTCG